MKFRLFMIFLLCFVFTTTLFGQITPAFEGSLSYAFLRDTTTNVNRHGWIGSAAGNVNEWLGVKGELAGSYADFPNSSIHSFLAGPQFSAFKSEGMTPWGQFLLGLSNTKTTLTVVIRAPVVLGTASDSNFAIQPGVGVDFWMAPNFGVRLGADYRHSFRGDLRDLNYGRLHAGIVFRVGEK
jgi:opacity protein-like surface antigen